MLALLMYHLAMMRTSANKVMYCDRRFLRMIHMQGHELYAIIDVASLRELL